MHEVKFEVDNDLDWFLASIENFSKLHFMGLNPIKYLYVDLATFLTFDVLL
jgi:hypothetical protein